MTFKDNVRKSAILSAAIVAAAAFLLHQDSDEISAENNFHFFAIDQQPRVFVRIVSMRNAAQLLRESAN